MSAAPPPTTRRVYRSAASRRRRRRQRLLVAVALVLVVVAALVVSGVWLAGRGESGGPSGDVGGATPTTPAASASPALRLVPSGDVEVHEGRRADFRYKALGPSGRKAPIFLVVADAGGAQVKAKRLLDARSGSWVTTTLVVDLDPGDYTYVLRLGEMPASTSSGGSPASPSPSAGSNVTSASAVLRVLPPLPPGFPGKKAVAGAQDWIAGRDGQVAFAVVDTNGEDAGGYREHEPFQLASLAKAILLVASLRSDPSPDATTEATLTKMITESDNGAAYAIYGQVGAKGMQKVAGLAGMRDYEQGSDWIDTRASAWDEAHFFWELESLVPKEGRPLARKLLSGVIPIQRWGIPAAAGPAGWTSYFKGGWIGLDNKLMVQAASLEQGARKWSVAVMSDDNPTRSYGWDTQKGVTGLLLGQEPTPAYLSVVLE